MTVMRFILPFLLIAAQASPPSPIFRFESNEFWLNLHHYLYVLGRAQEKARDASRAAVANAPADEAPGLERLSEAERGAWREAVAAYANGLSRKDIVFDDPLPAITKALADADEAASLSGAGLDAPLVATLERAAPIYRKAWWPAHQAANRARQADVQALVDRHGRQILQTITRAYTMEWPAGGYPVHFSAFANWAGAYSTRGDLLVVSSLAEELRGTQGLETVFHEGMHQWDDAVETLLRDRARRLDKRLPPDLSHAMIFFTAGESVRRVIPDHIPYAEAAGVWARGLERFKIALEETWKPYLDGRGSRDEAIAALVARTGLPVQRNH